MRCALPLYEYKCTTCNRSFEVMQSMSEDPLARCNASVCVREDGKRKGNGRVSRVLFAPAIHFKGTGFHNTDYGTKRRGGPDDDGGGSGSKDSGSKDSGSKDSGAASDGGASGESSSSSSKTVGLDKV
jgi:putative FmdB family regulatory protein